MNRLLTHKAGPYLVFLLVSLIYVPRSVGADFTTSQNPDPIESNQLQTEQKPFGLPFEGEPGPESWYIIQYYGNTQGAYRYREEWYQAGQGLHFGLDLAARCQTPIVAIGDGEIAKVDGLEHGAGPHNLLIKHDDGMISLYGHLYEKASVTPGQRVVRGEVVGLSGDPDGTCTSRPHLHLEIRSENYGAAYNPIDYIEADWDALALFGPSSRFQRDLDNPRRWQTLYDQPDVDFWGPMLNDFEQGWPPDQQ